MPQHIKWRRHPSRSGLICWDMAQDTRRLTFVFEGWEGFHRSIVEAIRPLTADQLAHRTTSEMRSVGEIAWHIALGRVEWFERIGRPEAGALLREMEPRGDEALEAAELVEWLERTWKVVEATLERWTVDDIAATYRQPYQGKVYAVSRQWVIWRIMAHDIYHGGQLSEILATIGVIPLQLTLLGGHLTEPPLAE